MSKDKLLKARSNVLRSARDLEWLSDEGTPQQIEDQIQLLKSDIDNYNRQLKSSKLSKLRKVF